MTLIQSPPLAFTDERSDRYLRVDSELLRYRDEGQGAAILLVHGWTLDLEMWEPQVSAFRDEFRVVRYDRRGFGLSSGRPSLIRDVEDMEALCRQLALGPTALVGMSQGARAVLGFAMAFPKNISCLILDGPPDCLGIGGSTEDDLPLHQYRELIRTQGINAFRLQWREHPLVKLITSDLRQRELVNAMIGRYSANDLLESPVNVGPALDPARLELLTAPVLIVTGAHDTPRRTEIADALASRLPNAQRAVVPTAGHLANLDNPKHYNAIVGAFLARHTVALN
jgi:3-oxoadipate enol-lactonase